MERVPGQKVVDQLFASLLRAPLVKLLHRRLRVGLINSEAFWISFVSTFAGYVALDFIQPKGDFFPQAGIPLGFNQLRHN